MLRAFALAFLLALVAGESPGQSPPAGQADAVPADAPKLARHVTDLTGTLTDAQAAQLEAQLSAFEQRKGSQVAVYMVSTLGNQSLEDYALAIAEKNKLGRSRVDDGVLLFIAKDDRKIRIEVGYGLEGAIPDAKAGRIIREYLAPNFRKGDYDRGISEAVVAITSLIDGEELPPPKADADGRALPAGLPALLLGLFIGLMAAGTRLKPAFLRRSGAGIVAGALAFVLFSTVAAVLVAAFAAFFMSGAGAGRFSSGRGSWGSFPSGTGWGGGGGGSGGFGGGWGGGGGGFGGGGASGGW